MAICHNCFVIYMKNKVLVLMFLMCCACSFTKKNEDVKKPSENHIEEKVQDDVDIKDEYIDDNNTPIALYEKNGSSLKILNEFSSKIMTKKDIKTFQAFLSNEPLISYAGKKYANFYYEKYNEINKDHKYKVGFNLKYTLNDGTVISQNIFNPSTTQTNYDYIEVYLYDAYKHRNDSFYSHIEEKEYNDDTLITSIKLTAGSKFNDIKSKIILTVFTYDDDDFDEVTKEYRGNSKYSIAISDLNKTYEEN